MILVEKNTLQGILMRLKMTQILLVSNYFTQKMSFARKGMENLDGVLSVAYGNWIVSITVVLWEDVYTKWIIIARGMSTAVLRILVANKFQGRRSYWRE